MLPKLSIPSHLMQISWQSVPQARSRDSKTLSPRLVCMVLVKQNFVWRPGCQGFQFSASSDAKAWPALVAEWLSHSPRCTLAS